MLARVKPGSESFAPGTPQDRRRPQSAQPPQGGRKPYQPNPVCWAHRRPVRGVENRPHFGALSLVRSASG
jgi:hypothetical protein